MTFWGFFDGFLMGCDHGLTLLLLCWVPQKGPPERSPRLRGDHELRNNPTVAQHQIILRHSYRLSMINHASYMILYNATCIHDNTWYIMIYHDISWWIMVNQIWYTPTLIRFWLPSPSLAHWNWHHIKVLRNLSGHQLHLPGKTLCANAPGRSGIHRNGWKISWWHMVNYGDMVMQCIRNHCTKNWLWILSNAP